MRRLLSVIPSALSCLLLFGCSSDATGPRSLNSPAAPSSILGSGTAIDVSGTMYETVFQYAYALPIGVIATASDRLTGDLAGQGLLHIVGSTYVGLDVSIDILSRRTLSTADGHLFLDEVGQHIGDVVTVQSTVTGGTGRFKNATGHLTLVGAWTPGFITFTYTGTLTLP